MYCLTYNNSYRHKSNLFSNNEDFNILYFITNKFKGIIHPIFTVLDYSNN